MFITFEGPDGAGKTTQIRLLARRLESVGRTPLTTREPGGSPVGERLRSILLAGEYDLSAETEALLMSADRAEHVRTVIRPALARDVVVISDRYLDSTLAYQGGGRGLSMSRLRGMQELATGGLLPDVTVLLDLPVKVGLSRKQDANEMNRLDNESIAFHERVARTFRWLAEQEPSRWVVVDATQEVDMVHTAIWSSVSVRLLECGDALMRGGNT